MEVDRDKAVSNPQPEAVRFTGNASDYFGIWVVNVLLSIITLGVWSAWAKVRRIQYFSGHTLILGDRLEYRATGWMIFKGRVLAVLAILVLTGLSNLLTLNYWSGILGHLLPFIPTLCIVALYPWAINRSLKFSARFTSWRNVNFNWHGTYWGALKNFFVWPFLGFLTLGLLYPLAARAVRHHIFNNSSFGTTKFAAQTKIKPFYIAAFKTLLFFIAFILLIIILIMLIGALFFNDTQKLHAPGGIESLIPLLFVIVGSYTSVVFMVLTRNIIINSLKLGTTATFRSNLRVNRFLWISFSNLILTVLTVFLMYPWAKIRSYRYQAEALTIEPKVTVAAFTDDEVRKQSALGEEFGEFQDIDISI